MDGQGAAAEEPAPEDEARLDEASHIELGFPHDFLAQLRTRSIVDHRA